jgi:D-3-phosphoglycerate dehydrogenase
MNERGAPERREGGEAERLLVSTVPFCRFDKAPRAWLDEAGIEVVENPVGRRLKEDEIADMIGGYDYLIAGTEPVTDRVLSRADRLKLIVRVGIGLDSVDLAAARARGVAVSYTPDAPSPGVSELTIGLMLALLRQTHIADRTLHAGGWDRLMGRRLAEVTVGVIGVGRIGKRVIRHLREGFPGVRLMANDLVPDQDFATKYDVIWAEKDAIYRHADVITLHMPLTPRTRDMMGAAEFAVMKPDAVLVNTARGGIVNEAALAAALREGGISGAAVDAFVEEPYSGALAGIDHCILTCHMGSMTQDCRTRMEREATQEVLRQARGEPLRSLAPEAEYSNQAAR